MKKIIALGILVLGCSFSNSRGSIPGMTGYTGKTGVTGGPELIEQFRNDLAHLKAKLLELPLKQDIQRGQKAFYGNFVNRGRDLSLSLCLNLAAWKIRWLDSASIDARYDWRMALASLNSVRSILMLLYEVYRAIGEINEVKKLEDRIAGLEAFLKSDEASAMVIYHQKDEV